MNVKIEICKIFLRVAEREQKKAPTSYSKKRIKQLKVNLSNLQQNKINFNEMPIKQSICIKQLLNQTL